ncbi:Lactoylglutathione lyase [Klebsiella variicola]|nr:Lactoylglutathione lyase [Klebsiella variicola]
MFSYIMLGTNDLPRAIKFYDPLMALLGHVKAGRNEQGASWGTFNGNHTCGLCVGTPFDQQPAGVGMERWWRSMPAPSNILRNCMPSPCNSADVTKAVPVTGRSMATVFTAPTSAIPTAISWRLFIMRGETHIALSINAA